MTAEPGPTPAHRTEVAAQRNWARWGAGDQRGAANLITGERRRTAARSVTTGRCVSLARVVDPDTHGVTRRVSTIERAPGDGAVMEQLEFQCHGFELTHVDALSHLWIGGEMWGGHRPDRVVSPAGIQIADIDQWHDGLVTRAVLVDVAGHRGSGYVEIGNPVSGEEIRAILDRQGTAVEPGDALVVHCGRRAWETRFGSWGAADPRPGLDASCALLLRELDVAVLVWDMMDVNPNDTGAAWPVHIVLQAFGIALVDNAELTELAAACAEEGRSAFMLVVAPLRLVRGSGSPVNPLAIL